MKPVDYLAKFSFETSFNLVSTIIFFPLTHPQPRSRPANSEGSWERSKKEFELQENVEENPFTFC